MSWIIRSSTLAIVVAGCLWPLTAEALAADDTGGSIVITLPADLSPEQRDAFMEALGRLEQPLIVDRADAVPAVDDGAVGGVAVAIGRFDDAMLAAAQIPDLIATW